MAVRGILSQNVCREESLLEEPDHGGNAECCNRGTRQISSRFSCLSFFPLFFPSVSFFPCDLKSTREWISISRAGNAPRRDLFRLCRE
jgi:hypothetical protein